MGARPTISFIAWAHGDSRPRTIAAELGGEARVFHDMGIVAKPLVPLRYAVNAARTLAYLVRRRPRAVIIQAPPVPTAWLMWLYAKLFRAAVVIDAHPSSFAIGDAPADRAMLPLLRWLAPRVQACAVTTDRLRELVDSWGGRGLVVHEPAPAWAGAHERRAGQPANVIFICTFAADEPLDAVLAAARELPDVRFRITGDTRKLRARDRQAAPDNVDWTGYLRGSDYPQALADADAVITLDERDQSVPRSAYEAVYARRPLITTDYPHMRALFPHAVFVQNTGQAIAAGVRSALADRDDAASVTSDALELQVERWGAQRDALRAAVGAS
jgi:glycosyltransferase involved in cell wall biosynthesis